MKRTTVESLKRTNQQKLIFLVPGTGIFEYKSLHMARHFTSNLIPGAGNFISSDFKSSNGRGWLRDRGATLRFGGSHWWHPSVSGDNGICAVDQSVVELQRLL